MGRTQTRTTTVRRRLSRRHSTTPPAAYAAVCGRVRERALPEEEHYAVSDEVTVGSGADKEISIASFRASRRWTAEVVTPPEAASTSAVSVASSRETPACAVSSSGRLWSASKTATRSLAHTLSPKRFMK